VQGDYRILIAPDAFRFLPFSVLKVEHRLDLLSMLALIYPKPPKIEVKGINAECGL
jgi:hypothetical protein